MSKLKFDNIKFDNDDFIIEVKHRHQNSYQDDPYKRHSDNVSNVNFYNTEDNKTNNQIELNFNNIENIEQQNIEENEIINQAKLEAEKIITQAQNEAQEKILSANEKIENKKKELENLQNEIILKAQNEADEIIKTANEQIEQEKIKATNEGYQEGYKDAQEKLREELQEKLQDFDKFCAMQFEIKDKILKSSSKEIIKIIENISRKILLEELDGNKLKKIIQNTILLLEQKENINVYLSEKYAKLLSDIQNNSLSYEMQNNTNEEDIKQEFNFSEFKQYENFKIICNPKFAPDTIIVENLQERFSASLNKQLDVIIRNIYENIQNETFEIEIQNNNETE